MSPKLNYILPLLVIAGLWFFMNLKPEGNSGKLAPDFSAELMDGSSFQLSDLRGSYVLLDFWGSWCPPCRRNNKELVQLYAEYKGKKFNDADGFHIVSVAIEKNDKTWRRAIKKDELSWPHHILKVSRLVLAEPLALKYNVKDLPTLCLINPQGEIVAVNPTISEMREVLK